MHASVQQFVLAWGSPDELRRARTVAATEYTAFVKTPGARWSDQTEAIRLFMDNGDSASAWPLAREYVLWLRQSGQYRAAASMLGVFSGSLCGNASLELTALLVQLQHLAGIPNVAAEDELRDGLENAETSTIKATALHEVAVSLSRRGCLVDAEPLLRESISIKEKAFGRKGADLASSLQELASVLAEQGRLLDAERLLLESAALVKESLGQGHFAYGRTLHSLATVLWSQNRHADAVRILNEALRIKQAALGPNHPMLMDTISYLALVAVSQGRAHDGILLLERAIAIGRDRLGDEHPDTQLLQHHLRLLSSEV